LWYWNVPKDLALSLPFFSLSPCFRFCFFIFFLGFKSSLTTICLGKKKALMLVLLLLEKSTHVENEFNLRGNELQTLLRVFQTAKHKTATPTICILVLMGTRLAIHQKY
jgi:hypothetical protein